MLAVSVTVNGDKVIIEGLNQLAAEMPRVAQRGLKRIVRGTHREAMYYLNGAGGAGRKAQIVGPSRGFVKKSGEVVNFKPQLTGAGGYPVPVRTGNLKRLLDFIDPGQSMGAFSAGPLESVLFDSAEYASVVHDATGSSARFGKRPYLTDALTRFNQGNQIEAVMEDEQRIEIQKQGLA
jgi:hypothetical protein